MNIKHLPAHERPRERLARHGSDALSTIELLAILLGSGTERRSVLELAGDLLAHFGSLAALSEASLEELKQVKGIGEAKAIQLKAVFGLLLRIETKKESLLLDTPEAVFALIHSELAHQKTEVLMVVLRDVRKCCVHREIIAKGTLTEILMHPREIFHTAIRHRAHSLIVAHNHPSGDPTPSTRDLEVTQVLVVAGKVVGIELSDHIIVGRESFVSLYKKGLLPRSQF
ncbi:MAG TPA: DNA repair protein RadC [Chlamydiales bacterium]|nr:DNA repair protein RadC [Chlamydiales bacterium]